MTLLKQRFIDRQVVARGNFATSYRATDAVLGRPVFLKVLQADLSADPDVRARFEREARAAARLEHPHLVRLHDFGDDPEDGMYMVFEWVRGSSLAETLKRTGVLPDSRLRQLAEELLAALTVLHGAGIVHRDIKPENILLDEHGHAKLTDFSLAIPLDEPRVTHHRGIVGTPAYMSPEQVAGKLPTQSSDFFSLGIVLYEAATGTNPFRSSDVMESLRLIRETEPPWNDERFAALADDLKVLIGSCLAKSPDQRIASATDALTMIGARGSVPRLVPRRRAIWTAVGLGSVALLIWLISALTQDRSSTPPEQIPVAGRNEAGLTDSSADSPRQSALIPQRDSSVSDRALESRTQSVTARSPVKLEEKRNEPETAATSSGTVAVVDSVNVQLDVRPWAQVAVDGRRLGTSPFRSALRLPTGSHTFTFTNTEMPRLELTIPIHDEGQRVLVDLAAHLAAIEVQVLPWGIISVDGDVSGTAPLKRPLFVSPGMHVIRISHPSLSSVEQSFTSAAGETLHVVADLDRSVVSLEPSRRSRP